MLVLIDKCVIPAEVGIQNVLDSGFRRNDEVGV
jgi:hypothetical protein